MPLLSIEPEDQGVRLDVFLTARSVFSRAQIQKLIKAEQVLVNDRPCKPHYRLQTGEHVLIPELEMAHPPIRKGEPPILQIIFENDDLLVIHKPAGLIVHPTENPTGEPTLVDALLERDPDMAQVGDNPLRPGIVHRLDKDVSGLMVIAKTNQAFASLKSQFQNHTVYKEYIALVYGALSKDHDLIEMKIARSKARGRMVARPISQEGKTAKTEYSVEQRFKNHTLVHVILHTGRTHQIRVHFRAINHPIVGDRLYKKTYMKNIRPIELNRIFLHAYQLRFRLMDGTQRTFTDPLPNDLNVLLKHLAV